LLIIIAWSLPLIFLQIFRPIKFPFADDWLLIKYLIHSQNSGVSGLLEPINGHQMAFTKSLLWTLGNIPLNPVQLVAASSFAFLIAALIMFLKSSEIYLAKKNSNALILVSLTALFSYKSMQNYFMPICAGWIHALFFVSLFHYAKNRKDSRNIMLTSIAICLAPLTIGLGLCVPLAQISEFFYLVFKSRSRIKLLAIYYFTLSIFIILMSYLLPKVIYAPTRIDTASQSLHRVGITAIFKSAFALLGSASVPASRFDAWLPPLMGLIVFLFYISLLIHAFSTPFLADDVARNRIPLLTGIFFIILVIAMRTSNDINGLLTAAAPRYVTGTSIFIFSLILIGNKININDFQKKTFLILGIMMILSGLKTGVEWSGVRYSQSQSLVHCVDSNKRYYESVCLNELKSYALVSKEYNSDSEFLAYLKVETR
jgi:hypothetical protein